MSAKKPMLLVLAGPNGSGKSTITPYFDKVGEYTNADLTIYPNSLWSMDRILELIG